MSTQDVAAAFARGANKASGNHMTTCDGERSSYYLHGHKIAVWDREEGTIWVGNAGFATVTTAKAVNAVLGAFPWLGASVKSWVLTDAIGKTARVGKDGVTLHRHNTHCWSVEAPVSASGLAPTLSK